MYEDFESILVPYSTCDKEYETCKKVNKQVPCGYTINVANSHDRSSKQSYYRRDDAVSEFCKEIRKLAYKHINTYKQPMIDLIECGIYKYENAKYCHKFVRKCLVRLKRLEKYVIMIITQVNLGVPHIQYAI